VNEIRVYLGISEVHQTCHQDATIIIHMSNMCLSKKLFLEGIKSRIGCWMRLLHQDQKAWCTRRKEKQTLRRSCDTGMRSAQSGDCFLPPAGARICKGSHTGIEGEHWAQCARVRRWREEYTLIERQSWGPSNDSRRRTNDSRRRMVNWELQSKTPPESGRRTHLLYFTYLYCILSHV